MCAPWETTTLPRIGGRSLKQVPVSVQPANMDVLRTAVQSIDATYGIKLLGLERVVVPIVSSWGTKALAQMSHEPVRPFVDQCLRVFRQHFQRDSPNNTTVK